MLTLNECHPRVKKCKKMSSPRIVRLKGTMSVGIKPGFDLWYEFIPDAMCG